MTTQNKKWSDEAVATLNAAVGSERPVSAATVEAAAQALGADYTTRSVASKLRQLDIEVASMAKEKAPTFTDVESKALSDFVNGRANQLTYAEIAQNFNEGKFTAKQIQGKLLALELTSLVKPAEKIEAVRSYSDEAEATFVKMAKEGAYLEDIAAALGRELASVRGKALSLSRSGQIANIPAQRSSHAVVDADPLKGLGDAVASMTVAEIAGAIDKTERGVKTMLTRRGIKVADYDGAGKKEKAEAKATA